MTKSPRKNVPDAGIELGAACMPSEHASDRATAPGPAVAVVVAVVVVVAVAVAVVIAVAAAAANMVQVTALSIFQIL